MTYYQANGGNLPQLRWVEPNQREFPMEIPKWWEDCSQPQTQIEALMRCRPHQDPQASSEERMIAREEVGAAFACLTDEERWVFNAVVIERMSLRGVVRQLSLPKTTVARIRDRAARKLREALKDSESVQAVLKEMDFR